MRPSLQRLPSPPCHPNLSNVLPYSSPTTKWRKAPLHPSAAPRLIPSISTHMDEVQTLSVHSPPGSHSFNIIPCCPKGPGSGWDRDTIIHPDAVVSLDDDSPGPELLVEQLLKSGGPAAFVHLSLQHNLEMPQHGAGTLSSPWPLLPSPSS